MLNAVAAFVGQYQMLQPGETVVCAVSGGADSVALLMAMYLLREKLQVTVEAVHFNHGLRGQESDAEEAFVRQLCDRYDIPLHVGRGQVAAGKKGLEAAARDARYSFFATLPGKIATAHTADDNAETVLMHMVRGTGLKGLGAIAPVRGNVVRPMLLVTRQQVLAFLQEYHLRYMTDSSNETDQFLRNRLRHHVMPLLKQENPRLAESLSAMALRLRRDEEALDVPMDFSKGLPVETVRALPEAVRSRVITGFLKHCGVKEPEGTHIALGEKLVFSEKPSASGEFPGGIRITRRYGVLVRQEAAASFAPVMLACPGVTQIPELGLRVICTPAEAEENTPYAFTAAPVGQLWLRPRQEGDTLRLSGGTKSLKKLFIDRKIPAAQRSRIPVVCDGQGLLGVYGIGVNQDRMGAQLQIRFETIENEKSEDTL